MKTTRFCWEFSSHQRPCATTEVAQLPATPPARRAAAAPARRASHRAAQLAAYWMQATVAGPELPAANW